MKKQENALYALHLNGQLLSTNIWKEYSKNYGNSGLYGWKAPKRIYFRLEDAKKGLSHLPHQIRNKVEIVKYLPIEENKQ